MDCIFCKIVKGEIPSTKIYEDAQILVFRDIHPKAPTHILVVPKKHVASLVETKDEDASLLASIFSSVRKVTGQLGLDKTGYKVVINNGKDAGQLVFHLHLHVLGGWKKSPGWEV
jgi:histidine triad (HIT) family protein